MGNDPCTCFAMRWIASPKLWMTCGCLLGGDEARTRFGLR